MIDYRNLKLSDVLETVSTFNRSEHLRDEVLDGLLAVAVWHSIKDGQITPAQNLLGACSRTSKDRVSQYLTKYGNLQYTKEKGLQFSKAKNKVQSGLDKANEVFENLPTLSEAFPAKPKQYKDIPFASVIKHLRARNAELAKHGKTFTFANDEEKEAFDLLLSIA